MFELFTAEWGMRENMALAMVDFYGGHVWSAFNAIKKLLRHKDFNRDDFGLSDDSDAVFECISESKRVKPKSKFFHCDMTKHLTELAKSGFSPLPKRNTQQAQEISELNLGGVIRKGSLVLGFDDGMWNGSDSKFGLVPSRQSTRLAIAEKLHNLFKGK